MNVNGRGRDEGTLVLRKSRKRKLLITFACKYEQGGGKLELC